MQGFFLKLSFFFFILFIPLHISAAVKVPILMYHHIRTPQEKDSAIYKDLSCSRNIFLEHLSYLKKAGYTTITFWDLYNHFYKHQPLPPKPIILTFDDGPRNNWQAFLDLKANQQKGVFFIITCTLGSKKHLTREQLQAINEAGMEIGSHSVSHPDLKNVTKAALKTELENSKKVLEDLLHKKIISFCYPSGQYNEVVSNQLKKAGYYFARTTNSGISSIQGKDFQLKIIRIHNYTTAQSLAYLLKKHQ
ncbi:MAG: polysaccharide deacetylase family protein [Candidatus Margulisbacteria bacterium]|nr:polysaccharide deacetylase family protein [Candidatus Margulisiibacteriota bacterium]